MMVFRYQSSASGKIIIISMILVVIAILTGILSYTIPGLQIFFPLVSLVPVLVTGVWAGWRGIIIPVLIGSVICVTSFLFTGLVSFYAMICASLFLLAGFASAALSERMKIQHAKEAPLIAEGIEQPGSLSGYLGRVVGGARYCLLPFVNVQRLKEKKDVRGLIRALTSEDINVQYNATEALGDLRDPASVTALVHVLTEDRYSAVRWKAAEALAWMGEPAVTPLITALGHRNDDVRWKAAIALGEIRDTRAIGPLVLLLADEDHYVRGRAAYALAMIGQPAVPALIRVLEGGSTDARSGAVATLGKINDPRAIAPLVRALGDNDERVRSGALASFEQAETKIIDRFLVALNEAGAAELRTLMPDSLPVSGVPPSTLLEDIFQADSNLRRYLTEALKSAGDPAFEPLINDLLAGDDKK